MKPSRDEISGGRYAAVIREARKAAGFNQQLLAERLGISRNTVAGWETGHSRPDLDAVPSLCETLGISIPAFFGAREEAAGPEKEMLSAFRQLREEDRMAMVWQIQALVAGRRGSASAVPAGSAARSLSGSRKGRAPRGGSEDFSGLESRVVSIYRSDLAAAAGTGVTLDAEQGERVWLRKDRRTDMADEIIVVNGNSMEPTFADGEEVLVQHTEELREGEIGIFIVDGEGFIKEFRRDGLHSHNPAFGTMHFEDGNEVRCIGRVLGKVQDQERLSEQEARWMEGLE